MKRTPRAALQGSVPYRRGRCHHRRCGSSTTRRLRSSLKRPRIGWASDIGLDIRLDFNGLRLVERLGAHDRLSRCRFTGRVPRRDLASPPGLCVLETHEPWRVGGVAASMTVDGAGFDRATDCLGGHPNSRGGDGEGCPRRSCGIWTFGAGLVIHVLIAALLPWRTEFGGFDHWIIIALVFQHPSIQRSQETPTPPRSSTTGPYVLAGRLSRLHCRTG